MAQSSIWHPRITWILQLCCLILHSTAIQAKCNFQTEVRMCPLFFVIQYSHVPMFSDSQMADQKCSMYQTALGCVYQADKLTDCPSNVTIAFDFLRSAVRELCGDNKPKYAQAASCFETAQRKVQDCLIPMTNATALRQDACGTLARCVLCVQTEVEKKPECTKSDALNIGQLVLHYIKPALENYACSTRSRSSPPDLTPPTTTEKTQPPETSSPEVSRAKTTPQPRGGVQNETTAPITSVTKDYTDVTTSSSAKEKEAKVERSKSPDRENGGSTPTSRFSLIFGTALIAVSTLIQVI